MIIASHRVARRELLGLGFAATAVMFAPVPAWADATLDRIKSTGKVGVGIANEKPYGYVDTNGQLAGAVPEIILAALTPYGIKTMQAEIVEFNALIPGLNAGRFDIVGAGMYIRPKRCEAIAFTNPITRLGYGFAALKGNPKGVHSIADVAKNANAMVGTQTGSAQVEELQKAGVPPDRVVLFANATEALAGLKANRCDVIYFPSLELNELLKTANDPAVERVADFKQVVDQNGDPDYGYSALGLRKGDKDLKTALDAEIGKMLSSGKLLEIVARYGYGRDELPTANDTAERLCKA
jgi:polar amino acid transport system substrate-binding protein